jgi:hypothetical protein
MIVGSADHFKNPKGRPDNWKTAREIANESGYTYESIVGMLHKFGVKSCGKVKVGLRYHLAYHADDIEEMWGSVRAKAAAKGYGNRVGPRRANPDLGPRVVAPKASAFESKLKSMHAEVRGTTASTDALLEQMERRKRKGDLMGAIVMLELIVNQQQDILDRLGQVHF